MKIEANYLGDSVVMNRRKFYIVNVPSQLNYTLLVKHYYSEEAGFITMSKNLFAVKHPTLKNFTQLSLLNLKFHVSKSCDDAYLYKRGQSGGYSLFNRDTCWRRGACGNAS